MQQSLTLATKMSDLEIIQRRLSRDSFNENSQKQELQVFDRKKHSVPIKKESKSKRAK